MEVVVLEKNPHIPHGPCSLPYYISHDVNGCYDLIVLTSEVAERERPTLRHLLGPNSNRGQCGLKRT